MKDLAKKAGLASQFHIESAATSREEIGNPVYPPARRKLAEHGISCDGHAARQLTNQDYDKYDLLIGMDSANLRNMHRICGGDPDGKLRLLMDYTDRLTGRYAQDNIDHHPLFRHPRGAEPGFRDLPPRPYPPPRFQGYRLPFLHHARRRDSPRTLAGANRSALQEPQPAFCRHLL